MTTNATVSGWLDKDRDELDTLYMQASAGDIPSGETRGTAIVAGSFLARWYARLARLFAWQGKVFDLFPPTRESGILINKVSPFSLTFIVAKVYKGDSWMDGDETIIIDYSSTSFVAKKIRDEIREIEPGVYLGKVWWGRTRILDFSLTRKE